MPTVHDIARASRARKVRFALPDGAEVTVDPPSLDQVIECLLLDPVKGASETPLEEFQRLRRQARALIGPGYESFAKLDSWQIGQVVSTLYVAACGLDAEAYARWQLLQREAKAHREALEMVENLEKMSVELAPFMRMAPAGVGAEPLADLVALQESITRFRNDDREFVAGIRGITLD